MIGRAVRLVLAMAVLATLVVRAAAQPAERRVALVIGNAAYQNERLLPRLPNATSDSAAMAALLERLGFEVTRADDRGQRALAEALAAFSERADGAALALVFYAGHALEAQLGGERRSTNYLLPVDANPQTPAQLRAHAVTLDDVLRSVDGAAVKVVILDACRDNRLAETLARGRGSVSRGLARVDTMASGTLLLFAAAPGQVADDGTGRNSPFTAALLEHLPTPGLELQRAFTQVSRAVQAATGGRQVPEVTARGLTADVVLAAMPARAPGAAAPGPAVDREGLFWDSIRTSRNAADFEAYLQQFPAGTFAPLARNRLAELRPPEQAAVPVPPPPARTRRPVQNVVGVYPERLAVFRDRRADGSDCPECPDLVVIPPGSFTMGVTDQEEQREGMSQQFRRRAQPLTPVTIAAAFALGRTEVTRAQYAAFMTATGRQGGASCDWRAPGFEQSERDPVVCVSWEDAQAYGRWLSERTGYEYRLPSEAEWEYAARAGTRTARWWGDAIGRGNAHCFDCGSQWDIRRTAPVGSFRANGFGLYDMLGNVWEWTEDCWNGTYAGRPTDGRAWLAGDCTLRVVRGGGWGVDPWGSRSGERNMDFSTGHRNVFSGFRVARTITP